MEFNAIDKQLVNPKELFNLMNYIDSIQAWGTSGKGDLSKYHFKLKKNVPSYYNLLYKTLLKKQKGYPGLQLREAVQNLAFYSEHDIPYHFFVCFTSLTQS